MNGGASIIDITNEEGKKSGAKVGFIITSVIGPDGRYRITGADDLTQILGDSKGEEVVILGVYPNGQEYYFEVKVE